MGKPSGLVARRVPHTFAFCANVWARAATVAVVCWCYTQSPLIAKCAMSGAPGTRRYPSGPGFFYLIERHDPCNAIHDLFVLRGLFQVVGGLQPHPHLRRAAKQTSDFQAHDGGQGFASRQNAMQHLAGYSERLGRSRHRQADRGQDVLLEDLARMNGRAGGPDLAPENSHSQLTSAE